jgi:hypothetical protein
MTGATANARRQRPAQSRRGSLVEAIANVAVEYLLALVTEALVFPRFGVVG